MGTVLTRALAVLSLALLTACGSAEEVGAPADMVSRAAYSSALPASITLVTVIRNKGDEGAHTGLIINGSQQVVFDPAGTFNHSRAMVERGDVLYGLTPAYRRAYIDYHTRETFRTVEQTVLVSPEVAEQALRLAAAHGPASKATCATSTASILRQLPGFESVPSSWFPNALMRGFAQIPGVVTVEHRDADPDDNSNKVAPVL